MEPKIINQEANELKMKIKGENRIWQDIYSKSQNSRSVTQTQTGQKLILNEGIRLVPIIREWIDSSKKTGFGKELKQSFGDEQLTLLKITETLLMLTSSILVISNKNSQSSRYSNVNLIQEKIFKEMSFDTTWRFVEVLIESCEFLTTKTHKETVNGTATTRISYHCDLPSKIKDELTTIACFAFFPEPSVEKPIDWEFTEEGIKGGYRTYQYEMVRFRGTVDYTKYSQNIFDAVNHIQSVPWKVNKEMIAIIKKEISFPNVEDFVKSEYPQIDPSIWDKGKEYLTEEEVAEVANYFKEVEIYRAEKSDFESEVGKYRAVKLALEIAELYQDYDEIYFPHSYDFRGRVYPIPVGLSPQGSDCVKSMIDYKHGEKLNERGKQWAYAYLASLYGDDKLPFLERVSRGQELMYYDWKQAEEPFQFLSHQLELKKLEADPNYEFKGRVHLDACNSGSQFTSAMTNDIDGCMATNVTPTIIDGQQTRQDAYILVADKALSITNSSLNKKDPERKEELEFFRDLLQEKGRKVCKTPTMVSNYGGTEGGRSEIVWDLLREFKVDRKFITKSNAALFSKIIGQSIVGVLHGGKAFESYIHSMSAILTKANKPTTWTTSDGFHVVHVKKKEGQGTQISCLLPGSRKVTTLLKKRYLNEISARKMKSAISPNFVHSLDAELLRKVLLRTVEEGIVNTDWIHDSFGCLPNHVDKLLQITKEEFISLMQSKPLELLDEQLRSQVEKSKPNVKLLDAIKIPNLSKTNRPFDIAQVMESDWFFS
jgi:DNA-directed RNA polymerase